MESNVHRSRRTPFTLAFALTLILLSLPTFAVASDLDVREHIEVIGTAEVKVVPDEFIIRTTVQSFHRSLKSASKDNERRVSKAFVAMKSLGVERRYIVSDDITVNAVTEGYREQGNFRLRGYTVSRNLMVVVHQSTQVQPAIRKLFDAGVDRLNLTLGHTQMPKHISTAHIAAAKQARSKAKSMSEALGRSAGKAIAIQEERPQPNRSSNFVYGAATPDLGDSLSLGKLKVVASVKVKFLLE